LAACGHDFRFWLPDQKCALDAFHEFEPDVFLGTTYDLDRAQFKAIAARPHLKVALFASAWGELVRDLDPQKYPLVRTTDPERQTINRLKNETGRPDLVFVHVTEKYLEGTLGGWRELGVPIAGVLNAADVFEYGGGHYREQLACDVGFVGGYWGYKAKNLDQYLLPLCHPESGLNVKIFGNNPWPVHNYLGRLDDGLVKDLFVSASVCPNVSEPHSTDLGWDVVERPFKVLAAGGFCVSDHVDELRQVFSAAELPAATSPGQFQELVRSFVSDPASRYSYREAGRQKVFAEHTYFHRVHQILNLLGLASQAQAVLDRYAALAQQWSL
jgi:hypothetical protein